MVESTIQNLLVVILLVLGVLIWDLNCGQIAMGGLYTDSAHGNTGYAVLRTSLSTPPNDYARGNCGHCHEQHASIGGAEPAPVGGPDEYLVFHTRSTNERSSPRSGFCFNCHGGRYQTSPITINRSYSYNFGGKATAYNTTISEQFKHTTCEKEYSAASRPYMTLPFGCCNVLAA